MRAPWKRRRRRSVAEDLDVLICVHATGRTRRLCPGAAERSCSGCDARILVNETNPVVADMVLVCPSCAIKLTTPDDRPAGVLPGTVAALERHGVTDARAFAEQTTGRTVHELAAAALRSSVGGQG